MTPEEFLKREQEIQEAVKAYPGREMGEAYRLWKAIRGGQAEMLNSGDASLKAAKEVLKQETGKKPCTVKDCDGEMILEAICSGCVEGKAGFKSKWICAKCLFRELSKEDYFETLRRIVAEGKA